MNMFNAEMNRIVFPWKKKKFNSDKINNNGKNQLLVNQQIERLQVSTEVVTENSTEKLTLQTKRVAWSAEGIFAAPPTNLPNCPGVTEIFENMAPSFGEPSSPKSPELREYIESRMSKNPRLHPTKNEGEPIHQGKPNMFSPLPGTTRTPAATPRTPITTPINPTSIPEVPPAPRKAFRQMDSASVFKKGRNLGNEQILSAESRSRTLSWDRAPMIDTQKIKEQVLTRTNIETILTTPMSLHHLSNNTVETRSLNALSLSPRSNNCSRSLPTSIKFNGTYRLHKDLSKLEMKRALLNQSKLPEITEEELLEVSVYSRSTDQLLRKSSVPAAAAAAVTPSDMESDALKHQQDISSAPSDPSEMVRLPANMSSELPVTEPAPAPETRPGRETTTKSFRKKLYTSAWVKRLLKPIYSRRPRALKRKKGGAKDGPENSDVAAAPLSPLSLATTPPDNEVLHERNRVSAGMKDKECGLALREEVKEGGSGETSQVGTDAELVIEVTGEDINPLKMAVTATATATVESMTSIGSAIQDSFSLTESRDDRLPSQHLTATTVATADEAALQVTFANAHAHSKEQVEALPQINSSSSSSMSSRTSCGSDSDSESESGAGSASSASSTISVCDSRDVYSNNLDSSLDSEGVEVGTTEAIVAMMEGMGVSADEGDLETKQQLQQQEYERPQQDYSESSLVSEELVAEGGGEGDGEGCVTGELTEEEDAPDEDTFDVMTDWERDFDDAVRELMFGSTCGSVGGNDKYEKAQSAEHCRIRFACANDDWVVGATPQVSPRESPASITEYQSDPVESDDVLPDIILEPVVDAILESVTEGTNLGIIVDSTTYCTIPKYTVGCLLFWSLVFGGMTTRDFINQMEQGAGGQESGTDTGAGTTTGGANLLITMYFSFLSLFVVLAALPPERFPAIPFRQRLSEMLGVLFGLRSTLSRCVISVSLSILLCLDLSWWACVAGISTFFCYFLETLNLDNHSQQQEKVMGVVNNEPQRNNNHQHHWSRDESQNQVIHSVDNYVSVPKPTCHTGCRLHHCRAYKELSLANSGE